MRTSDISIVQVVNYILTQVRALKIYPELLEMSIRQSDGRNRQQTTTQAALVALSGPLPGIRGGAPHGAKALAANLECTPTRWWRCTIAISASRIWYCGELRRPWMCSFPTRAECHLLDELQDPPG